MSVVSTTIRASHLLSNAAWFGGALAGAVALNPAAAAAQGSDSKMAVASEGWRRWSPVQQAAIGVHLASGVAIIVDNRRRVATDRPTQLVSAAKTVLTGAAVAVTAANSALGRKVGQQGKLNSPSDPLQPPSTASSETAKAQQQLRIGQWALPALTGALLVLDAQLGEQQRGIRGLLDA